MTDYRVMPLLEAAMLQLAEQRDAAVRHSETMAEMCVGALAVLDRAIDMLVEAGAEREQLNDLRAMLEEFDGRLHSEA